MSRTVRVQVMVGLLAVFGVPNLARGQAASQADFQARFDRAFAVFNSARQPEAIPQFSQLIDDLRALPNRTAAQTSLLARALQYRAQARENVGQTADADADLRLIRELAPNFRMTETGLSASLVGRFNALISTPSTPALSPQTAPPGDQPAASQPRPKLIMVSGGYQFVKVNDCDDCAFPGGFYADVAGQILPFLSLMGEVSGASGSCCFDPDSHFSILFFGGGARVHPPLTARLFPFGQVLFGGARQAFKDNFGTEFSESKGAVNVSGGVDFLLTDKLSARAGIGYGKMFSEGGSWLRVVVGVSALIR